MYVVQGLIARTTVYIPPPPHPAPHRTRLAAAALIGGGTDMGTPLSINQEMECKSHIYHTTRGLCLLPCEQPLLALRHLNASDVTIRSVSPKGASRILGRRRLTCPMGVPRSARARTEDYRKGNCMQPAEQKKNAGHVLKQC